MSATRSVRRSTLLLMAQEMRERVGQGIRARRKELGIGPTEFARMMDASLKTVERWERGETDGALRHLDTIAEKLKTTPQVLTSYGVEEDSDETPDLLTSMNGDAGQHQAQLDRIEAMLKQLVAAIEPSDESEEREGSLGFELPEEDRQQDDQDEDEPETAQEG